VDWCYLIPLQLSRQSIGFEQMSMKKSCKKVTKFQVCKYKKSQCDFLFRLVPIAIGARVSVLKNDLPNLENKTTPLAAVIGERMKMWMCFM